MCHAKWAEWQVSGTSAWRWHCCCLQPCSAARCWHLFWLESGSLITSPVTRTCAGCYYRQYRLRQLRRIRRSLATLVYASTPLWILGSITATLFLLYVHQGQLRTSYSAVERGCVHRHRHSEVRSRPPGSDTARRASLAWRLRSGFFKLAVIVHRWLNGRAPLYTCRTTVSRPPVLTLGNKCVPATVNFLQYHVTGSVLMVAGPFQLPSPQSGTLSRIFSGTRPSVQPVFRRLINSQRCRRV